MYLSTTPKLSPQDSDLTTQILNLSSSEEKWFQLNQPVGGNHRDYNRSEIDQYTISTNNPNEENTITAPTNNLVEKTIHSTEIVICSEVKTLMCMTKLI